MIIMYVCTIPTRVTSRYAHVQRMCTRALHIAYLYFALCSSSGVQDYDYRGRNVFVTIFFRPEFLTPNKFLGWGEIEAPSNAVSG